MNTEKKTVDKERLIESLINLREELATIGDMEIVYKINSCLFSRYPHHVEEGEASDI